MTRKSGSGVNTPEALARRERADHDDRIEALEQRVAALEAEIRRRDGIVGAQRALDDSLSRTPR